MSALKRSIIPVSLPTRPNLIPFSILKSTMWTFSVRFALRGSIRMDSAPAPGNVTLVFREGLGYDSGKLFADAKGLVGLR